jgi:maltose O-acetyltransferase
MPDPLAPLRRWHRRRWHARLIASLGSAGEGVWFSSRPVHLSGAGQVHIGSNVSIGMHPYLRAEGGLTIGDNTKISRNLLLYTVNHDIEGIRLPYDDRVVPKPVSIGRNVWIGMNVCIAPGTTIGDGAVVGMGTVVSGTVPPLGIIGSAPWRIIGERDEEHYRRLEAEGRYGGRSGVALSGEVG